jgi:hypothetical protein
MWGNEEARVCDIVLKGKETDVGLIELENEVRGLSAQLPRFKTQG